MNKTLLRNIIVIVVVSSVLGLVYNFFSANGIPLIREKQKITYLTDEELEEGNIEQGESLRAVSLDQAYRQYEMGIQFIDARDNWDYEDGHIAGALNFPEFSFEPDSEIIKSLNKEYRYIIYCGSDDCDTSKRLAVELLKLGFKDLIVFEDGFEVWKENDYPVEVTLND